MKKLFTLLIILISFSLVKSQSSIIIGDSQSIYIAMNSKEAEIERELYMVGIGVQSLTQMLNQYRTNTRVSNVFVCIGVNDSYKDNGIERLVNTLYKKFPKANFYVIKGSYGWGNVRSVSTFTTKYREYYKKFRFNVLNTDIGYGDPHRQKREYQLIGKEIDNIIKFK